ncbi:hypothetical protein [Blautia sp. 1033sp1_1033st1_G9_1033SCRN_220408]|uniref:hypothetical protein n=1 Tax=Blautia sp. 1033sp1_1033st1_G9_1033SCRN_220408 TaxID=3144490 RepID=UPI0034A27139
MTEIISAREKSENEALIYKHIFSATCNSNILNLSIIIFLYFPTLKKASTQTDEGLFFRDTPAPILFF